MNGLHILCTAQRFLEAMRSGQDQLAMEIAHELPQGPRPRPVRCRRVRKGAIR
jgi:hypothetical protein